jgi:hypothetical protein
MKRLLISLFLSWLMIQGCAAAHLFVEAESFQQKGGWVVDQQFMDQMGSPYLMAHGMGSPVIDAISSVTFPKTGDYYVFVRTYNWTSQWKKGEGPGKFTLSSETDSFCRRWERLEMHGCGNRREKSLSRM